MDLFLYRLTNRGREITSEVICKRHFDIARDMEPLSASEKARGYEQTLREYTGDRKCAWCLEQAEQKEATA